MMDRWGNILRDAVIIYALTFLGGFVIGIGARLSGQRLPLAAIVVSNLVFGTVGFTVSGCLVRKNRFKHLRAVAVVTWLTGLINVWALGTSLVQWVASALFVATIMALGGGLSFLLVGGSPSDAALLTKRCPFCAEEILAQALVCKHCGRDLEQPPAATIQQ
jgi:hypothetical protein